MKLKVMLAVITLAAFLPAAHAGGRGGHIVEFKPVKSPSELEQLKTGDAMAKVCRGCDKVSIQRVETGGRAAAALYAPKCESCRSKNTYAATAPKQALEN